MPKLVVAEVLIILLLVMKAAYATSKVQKYLFNLKLKASSADKHEKYYSFAKNPRKILRRLVEKRSNVF